jgi:hypothetical protein
LECAKNFPYAPASELRHRATAPWATAPHASDCANGRASSWRPRRARPNELHKNHSLTGSHRTVIVITLRRLKLRPFDVNGWKFPAQWTRDGGNRALWSRSNPCD